MSKGYQLFISPHYIYPHDYSWQFTGAEQKMLLKLQVYQKQNAYTSPTVGADWVPSLKPYILDNRKSLGPPIKLLTTDK